MKRGCLWLGLGVGCSLAPVAAYQTSGPHIGQATEAEILALVPEDLREVPPDNPAAEARLRAAVALAKHPGPDMPKRLTILLDGGSWHVPESETIHAQADRRVGFEKLGRILVADMHRVEVLGLRANERRRAELGRTARLAFRFVDAYDRAGGGLADAAVIDDLVGSVCQGIVDAHDSAGLLRRDRFEIVKSIPEGGGRNAAMAFAVAREFRTHTIPRLIKAGSGRKGLEAVLREVSNKTLDMGTYDPLETTRLFVEFAQADQLAMRQGSMAVDSRLWKKAEGIINTLPVALPPSAGLWERVRYRWNVNHSPNTLGRAWAFPSEIESIGGHCEFRTYEHNQLRANLQDPGRHGFRPEEP